MTDQTPGPLDGLLVIDLTRFVSGPNCTMLMADAGATVIKVESPGGDPTRTDEPCVQLGDQAGSASFLRMNRNKLSIELDLKSEAGRAALSGLLERADVLVENFRAGVLARLGFDDAMLERLNSRLIYASISGFGHSPSSHRDRPAFNLIAEYEAGVYRQGGDVPAPLGPYVGDLFPGLHTLSGVLMALYRLSVTGRGSRVDVAMFDSMLSLNEAEGSNGTWMAEGAGAPENFYCPSGVFPSADGFVCLDVVTDQQWRALCRLIGEEGLLAEPRLGSGPSRVEHFESLLSGPLLAWLGARSSEVAVEACTGQGVPAAVVRQPGRALTGVQAGERGMTIQVGLEPGPGLTVPASPIRVNDSVASSFAVVPRAGADSLTVLGDLLGLTEDEVRRAQGRGEVPPRAQLLSRLTAASATRMSRVACSLKRRSVFHTAEIGRRRSRLCGTSASRPVST